VLLGRIIVSGIGLVVSGVFVAASASMNYAYLSRQAETPWEGQIFGAVAVAVTLYNAAGFFFIRWGWENGRRKLFVPVCVVFQLVFLSFSLLCALGFAASNRGAVTGSKDALAARLSSAQSDLKDAEAKLKPFAGKAMRPASVIEENLAEVRQDRRWQSSQRCEDATVALSLEYCRGYFQLRRELQSAIEFQRCEGLRALYSAEVLKLQDAGAGRESDPQASFIVRLLRGLVEIKDVQMWWVAFVALVVEMGAALGPFLATGHGFGEMRRNRRQQERRGLPALPQLIEGPGGTWQVVH
jgi:hypothetical protein